MKMSNRNKLIGFLILFVIIGVCVTGFYLVSHKVKTDPRKAMLVKGDMPVTLAEAQVATIKDVIGASGQMQEIERIVLTARVSQPVVAVRFDLGELVRKNQLLVKFDPKVVTANVSEATERLTKEKSNLAYRKLDYERMINLYNQKFIAKRELEKADQQVKDSQWEYSSAKYNLEKSLQDLKNTKVMSPITGVVLKKHITTGETPKLDEPLLTLGMIDNIYMLAKVAENKISYVSLKQKAEVVFDSFPNEIFTTLQLGYCDTNVFTAFSSWCSSNSSGS